MKTNDIVYLQTGVFRRVVYTVIKLVMLTNANVLILSQKASITVSDFINFVDEYNSDVMTS